MEYRQVTIFVCLCVSDANSFSLYKRGDVVILTTDYSQLYSMERHVKDASNPGFVLLRKFDVDVEFDMPTPEEIAALSIPSMEQSLAQLRAEFYRKEQKLKADIDALRALTYKGEPLQGDYVAADKTRVVNPADDIEDAEIIETTNPDDDLDIPF